MTQPNIGPRQRSLRWAIGMIAAIAVGLAVWAIVAVPLAHEWALLLVMPAFVAALSGYQASAGT